jgi:DNA anti-recombination protein RmuC
MKDEREELISAVNEMNWTSEIVDLFLAREQRIQEQLDASEAKYKDLNDSLTAELRDPNGTIWEHAKRLQDRIGGLEEELRQRVAQVHWKCIEIEKLEKKVDEAARVLATNQTPTGIIKALAGLRGSHDAH